MAPSPCCAHCRLFVSPMLWPNIKNPSSLCHWGPRVDHWPNCCVRTSSCCPPVILWNSIPKARLLYSSKEKYSILSPSDTYRTLCNAFKGPGYTYLNDRLVFSTVNQPCLRHISSSFPDCATSERCVVLRDVRCIGFDLCQTRYSTICKNILQKLVKLQMLQNLSWSFSILSHLCSTPSWIPRCKSTKICMIKLVISLGLNGKSPNALWKTY